MILIRILSLCVLCSLEPFSVNCFDKVFTALSPVCQAEIESRVELEKRLKQAEEALQDLEKGLNSMERTKERDEQMKGDVTQLRSEPIFSFSVCWKEYRQCSFLAPSSGQSMYYMWIEDDHIY